MGSRMVKKKTHEIIEILRVLLKICGAEGSRTTSFKPLYINIL